MQTGRYNYVTPTSYLELIVAFTTLVGAKRAEVSVLPIFHSFIRVLPSVQHWLCRGERTAVQEVCTVERNFECKKLTQTIQIHPCTQVLGAQHRYEKGLDKLDFTAKQVSVMRKELQALKPDLEKKVRGCVYDERVSVQQVLDVSSLVSLSNPAYCLTHPHTYDELTSLMLDVT